MFNIIPELPRRIGSRIKDLIDRGLFTLSHCLLQRLESMLPEPVDPYKVFLEEAEKKQALKEIEERNNRERLENNYLLASKIKDWLLAKNLSIVTINIEYPAVNIASLQVYMHIRFTWSFEDPKTIHTRAFPFDISPFMTREEISKSFEYFLDFVCGLTNSHNRQDRKQLIKELQDAIT